MIIGNSTASIYPFLPGSTLKLSPAGIKMSTERVVGAKLYPTVTSPTLLHVRKLEKTKDYIQLDIVDDSDYHVAFIYFSLSEERCPYNLPLAETEMGCVGYAIQNDELCGCLLGDRLLVRLLKSVPDSVFDMDSFILSPSVCFLRIAEVKTVGKLMYNDKEVKKISFYSNGSTIIGSASSGYTINTNPVSVGSPVMTVKGLVINGEHKLGNAGTDNVYILSGKDSGIRVISEMQGITIGRLSEL